jgi:hypothetical protein
METEDHNEIDTGSVESGQIEPVLLGKWLVGFTDSLWRYCDTGYGSFLR